MPVCPGLDEHGQSGDYSFANLGGMKASGNLEREADPAATTAFEASHSLTRDAACNCPALSQAHNSCRKRHRSSSSPGYIDAACKCPALLAHNRCRKRRHSQSFPGYHYCSLSRLLNEPTAGGMWSLCDVRITH